MSPVEASPQPESLTLSILLAEDHEDTAFAVTRLLRRQGCHVSHGTTVAAALALAAQETYDVLISDVGLPDGTGHDLLRQIRALHGHRQVGMRAIAVSGHGMEDDMKRSLAAGFDEHLVKPVAFPQLLEALHRVV